MITRDDALAELRARITEETLVHHALETETVLRGLAERLGQDQDIWGLAGLMHDLDYPETRQDPARHGLVSAELLAGQLPEEALCAIRAHNGERNGVAPGSPFDFALRAGETVTGLIHAAALVRPERMQGMEPKSLKKKMKDKAFARSVNREIIRECERLGLTLDEFLAIAIARVTLVAGEVGLA